MSNRCLYSGQPDRGYQPTKPFRVQVIGRCLMRCAPAWLKVKRTYLSMALVADLLGDERQVAFSRAFLRWLLNNTPCRAQSHGTGVGARLIAKYRGNVLGIEILADCRDFTVAANHHEMIDVLVGFAV